MTEHHLLSNGFEEAVDKFERQVTRLSTILGMQAENMHRQALGQSMAYVDHDFFNADAMLAEREKGSE